MPLIWPASLPQNPLRRGFGEDLPETAIRTQMDKGPAKVRQRTTAGISVLAMNFVMDETQFTALRDFFENTTAGGSLRFDFPHPTIGSNVIVRFLGTPSRRVFGSKWIVKIDLEVLPQ